MNARSAWLSPDGQTREDTRVTQVGAVTPVTDSKGRSGVLPGSDNGLYRVTGLWLAGTAGAMTATVSVGRAVVQSTLSRGAYPVAVTEPFPLTFTDGDAQYGRIDLVVLRIYDDVYDGLGRTEAAVEIVRGTPAAVPVVPATPDVSLVLFTVAVGAGVSAGKAGIDWDTARVDLRPTTVAIGGILPTRSDDTAPGGYPGHYRDVNSTLQRWDSAAWVAYPKGVGGVVPAGVLTTGGYAGQYRDSSLGQLQRWNGSAWLPAVPGPAFASSLDAGYTASATYTATLIDTALSALTLTFTAPPSGAVIIGLGARMYTSGSEAAQAHMSPQVTLGATVIWAADDERAASCSGAVGKSVSTQLRLGSLVAGSVYTVTAMHRSSYTTTTAVNSWFDTLFLRVDPIA
ncbi:hypothetical protein OG562_25815 [Streptomyces sp. NBC_01275]|uniref:hypothetical protein n=1 Tax=Streptomyces sp. NBC_01275 TaxID=2903807 RepID=UPI0022548E69|nr:hypothetical protein [Streptomyces sp. NBC_01275]MCX4764315.1 hypothetical protein [Streptomyces sp. NBC_01275]